MAVGGRNANVATHAISMYARVGVFEVRRAWSSWRSEKQEQCRRIVARYRYLHKLDRHCRVKVTLCGLCVG